MVLVHPTSCSKDNPLHMEVLNIKEHPWHMHNTMEVIYVLKGTLKCGVSIYTSNLEAGDIAVVNTQTLHHFTSDSETVVLCCHIDLEFFSTILPEIDDTLIICNSGAAVEYDKHYDILKNALATVFIYYFGLKESKQDELMDSCVNFLSVMYNHFNFLRHNGAEIRSENIMKQRPLQAMRVRRVMKYIYDNLGSKVSLEEIAAQEYVSKYYLSHLISEFLDMPFREYLNMTRAVYAQDYLYGTDMSLSEISDQCGFSSVELFRKAYLKYVGVTPAADRKKIHGHTVKDMPLDDVNLLDHISISEISQLMDIKSIHTAHANPLQSKSYPVNNVLIDYMHLECAPSENTWDTFALGDSRMLLAPETREALRILSDHDNFSKILIDGKSMASMYEVLGSWDFTVSFLETAADCGFSLVIRSDGEDPKWQSLSDLSTSAGGADILFTSGSAEKPPTQCGSSPVEIVSYHLSGNTAYPTLYDDASGSPYLFDKNNMKTPAFYAYLALNRLAGDVLYNDTGCTVTICDDKTSILLYNSPCGTYENSEIRKYMFQLKNLDKAILYQQMTLDEGYESEADILVRLSPGSSVGSELRKILQIKAFPDVEISTIAALPEYNLFLSSAPGTLSLIELK